VWAGASEERPPQELDAAIIFASVGALVPLALKAVRKGGVVVCGGIHMSDIPSFPYEILWEERALRSVANLTRADAREFLALAPKVPVKTTVVPMKLSQANEALMRLRKGEPSRLIRSIRTFFLRPSSEPPTSSLTRVKAEDQDQGNNQEYIDIYGRISCCTRSSRP